jgi:beta-lactamase class A
MEPSICVPVLALAALLDAQSVELLWERKLLAEVEQTAKQLDGVLGMAAIDLTTGRTISLNGDAMFPQASAIKIPIMMAMFEAAREGRLGLQDRVELSPKDVVGGSGRLGPQLQKGPVALTVLELITAMIQVSDNTATNRCIAMAGIERVNRLLDARGLRHTRLRRVMMDTGAARRGDENVSTPLEMADLAARLYRCEGLPQEDCRQMIAILKLVVGGMRKAVPGGVEIASKTGSVAGVKCETGIIYLPGRPFALSVQSTFLRAGEERNPVEEVTRLVYAYFERLAGANSYGHAAAATATAR